MSTSIHQGHRWFLWLAVTVLVLAYLLGGILPEALYEWPKSQLLPFKAASTAFMNSLLRESVIFGTPLMEWTRSFGETLNVPLRFMQSLLATGWLIVGETAEETVRIPPISWLSIVFVSVFVTYRISGLKLATLAGGTFIYFAVFGLWEMSMLTLASVVFIVVLGFFLGILLGTLVWRFPKVEMILSPIFDVMQTLPVFSYLVPVVLLFGFGPVSAVIVTIVFALPPMARATIVALKRVPSEIDDLAAITGSSRLQWIFKLLLPSARDDLLIGLNQLIMMTLAMVILASMIGAGGLGGEVLKSLQVMRFGQGLEAGLAISLIAILLYQCGLAVAKRRPNHLTQTTWTRDGLIVLALIIIPTAAGLFVEAFRSFPEAWTTTSEAFWSDAIDNINIRWGDNFEAARVFMAVNVLIPLRKFMLGFGWASIALALFFLGCHLKRPGLGIVAAAVVTLIAWMGYWPRTIITLHLVVAGILLASVVGVPLGIWSAASDRAQKVMDVFVSTIQTLPSLVYLVPIVMLMGPGSVSAVIAIAAFVVAAIIRYSDHALRAVPETLIEAAVISGATKPQQFLKVRLPVAVPGLLLGLNQVIMLGVGMVVVTALVGTRGLEQETVTAIAKVDPGRGLIAGLIVSAIAIIIDRYLGAVAQSLSSRKHSEID